jgi:hypothetical protein
MLKFIRWLYAPFNLGGLQLRYCNVRSEGRFRDCKKLKVELVAARSQRIVVDWQNEPNLPKRSSSGWLILDNRTMALVTDVDASAVYLPLSVLDDTGARRYVLPAS